MWLYWMAAITPLLITTGGFLFFGNGLNELGGYGSPEWLTLLGALLSYIGLATSAYAVIRISELSRRSFAKERLPDLLGSLANIGDQMATFSGGGGDLLPERFVAAIPALLRSIRRVRDDDLTRLANASLKAQQKLLKWAGRPENRSTPVNRLQAYWTLASLLNEIAVEVDERIKEERASR